MIENIVFDLQQVTVLFLLMMQDFSFEFDFEEIVNQLIDTFFTTLFDPTNPDSVLMVLFNLLPIVGSNPIDTEAFLLLVVSFGAFTILWRMK